MQVKQLDSVSVEMLEAHRSDLVRIEIEPAIWLAPGHDAEPVVAVEHAVSEVLRPNPEFQHALVDVSVPATREARHSSGFAVRGGG